MEPISAILKASSVATGVSIPFFAGKDKECRKSDEESQDKSHAVNLCARLQAPCYDKMIRILCYCYDEKGNHDPMIIFAPLKT